MKFIEFTYDTIDGQELNILAEVDQKQVYFKIFDGEKRISKGMLTTLDLRNIEDFARENSEYEIETESDYYERQND